MIATVCHYTELRKSVSFGKLSLLVLNYSIFYDLWLLNYIFSRTRPLDSFKMSYQSFTATTLINRLLPVFVFYAFFFCSMDKYLRKQIICSNNLKETTNTFKLEDWFQLLLVSILEKHLVSMWLLWNYPFNNMHRK